MIGGDSTYLRAAGLIKDCKVPILGLNSDPQRRTGALLNADITYDKREELIPRLVEDLMLNQFEYYYRTRALFEIDNQKTGESISKLCLNEVFAAEKDVSCTSMYKL
jgi:NAD kinase